MSWAPESSFEKLRRKVLIMGGSVEKGLSEVCTALANEDKDRLAVLEGLEANINSFHCKIDEFCLNIIATQAPVAKDLRLVLGIVKMNADLERLGDHTMNVMRSICDSLFVGQPLCYHKHLIEMSEIVGVMIKSALDSFARRNVTLAETVIMMDSQVNMLRDRLRDKVYSYLDENPGMYETAIRTMVIGEEFERMGDHTTNLAETVIFVETGEDVRHGSYLTEPSNPEMEGNSDVS